jgi:PiT family inorganic phosphate transporter
VIYTHSLTPNLAVVWSGAWNFIGVLISSGAVAFGILQLLPVELIIGVGSSQGFAMVFALLSRRSSGTSARGRSAFLRRTRIR